MRGTDIARVEGWWLNNGSNHSVPETQMRAPGLSLLFLIYLYIYPQIAWEITVMSFYDIMIVCSTLSAGKWLCMHKENAIICLHTCQHCFQNPQLLSLHPNYIIFSLCWISCLLHSPQVFQCALVPEPEFIYNI